MPHTYSFTSSLHGDAYCEQQQDYCTPAHPSKNTNTYKHAHHCVYIMPQHTCCCKQEEICTPSDYSAPLYHQPRCSSRFGGAQHSNSHPYPTALGLGMTTIIGLPNHQFVQQGSNKHRKPLRMHTLTNRHMNKLQIIPELSSATQFHRAST